MTLLEEVEHRNESTGVHIVCCRTTETMLKRIDGLAFDLGMSRAQLMRNLLSVILDTIPEKKPKAGSAVAA